MDCLIYASFFCQRGHCVAIYFWLVKEVDSLGEGVVRGDELFCYHSQIKCYQVWSSGIDWNRCLKNNQKIGGSAHNNQIYLVTFMCLTVDTSFIFTKKSNVAKCFFDIFNTEIAQCRQKLDVILGTKVVQF